MAARQVHTGRRPGATTTRALIEDAARKQFAERGYDRTSIRSIAKQAITSAGSGCIAALDAQHYLEHHGW